MINKLTRLIATGIDIYRGTAAYPSGAIMPFASALLTSDATAPADADTVVIDGKTYTFKTALTPTPFEVLIGISASVALDNLKAAVNGAAGAGTTYAAGTPTHPTVTAGTKTATTILFTAKTAGKAGNAIAVSETSAHLSWGSTTLTILEVDRLDMPGLSGEGQNQVEFTLVNVSDTSALITLAPEELFTYADNAVPQAEIIGYVPMFECLAPSSSKAMIILERTFTGLSSYSFSLPKTIADRVRIKMKADKAVTADLYESASVNQG